MPPSNKIANANAVNAPGFGLPLSTLLSQALVAFTIEFDNEFEHQMPHRTSHGRTPGSPQTPWLVSLVMWSNCMQFVGKKGISVGDLETLARTKTNLNGMERWGYIVVAPAPIDSRPKRPRSDWLIRATPAGRKAQDVWRPMVGAIEKRWLERFGKQEIGHLRDSLAILIGQMDIDLPDCLPILGYGLFSDPSDPDRRAPTAREDNVGSRRPLPALLSKALLAFAIEFERESDLSLAISANLLRVLGEKGVRVRDLPLVTGVSREAISVSMGILRKKGIVVVEPEPGGKGKLIRLTPTGLDAQGAYRQLLRTIEESWQPRFGRDTIQALRTALESLVGNATAERSPLLRGLKPYLDGWRASVRQPKTLPHYPMVLHRGGFPDGS